jgi:beta-glucanase (GH16 family)
MKKLILINAIAFTMAACGGGGTSKTETPPAPLSSSSVASSQAPSSSSAASSSTAATASNWEVVWSDEFEGSAIDTTKWSFEKNCTGGGNNELQCYTDRADNAFVGDGKLHIVAKKEGFSGQAKGDDDPTYNAGDTSVKRDYTSARLRTKNKGDWKYGRMEIRAKLPQGQGMWPAIWMLPTEWKYGGWPRSGEIDIMEAVNSNTGTYGNKVYGTLHYGDFWPNNKHEGTSYLPTTNLWDDFHTYAIEWEEGEIRWYVDNKHYMTETKKGWYTKGSTLDTAPFDQSFHMILNVAVGGDWPGVPDTKTTFPQEMTVDFVKVYRCTLNATTGKGCASNVDPAIKPLPGNPQVGGEFAPLPLFTMYDDALNVGLKIDSYNPNSVISYSQIAEPGHGNVLNVVKTGATGNVYFNIPAGAANLSAWSAGGQLVFNLKVNSMAAGAKLLIKMDSGWPSVSDVSATLPALGVWGEYRINVSDLIAKGNSIQSGIANLAAISNIFVIEPSAAMDVSFDNIRLEK